MNVCNIPVHCFFDQNTHNNNQNKECNDFEQNNQKVCICRTTNAGNDGQSNQTENVIDQRSSKNGITNNGVEFSHLFECFNSDGNRSRSQNNTNKYILNKCVWSGGCIKEERKDGTTD